MKSSPFNYITNKTHIQMKKSIHINVCIPVTITHVKENRKTEEIKNYWGHNDHAGYIYKFIQWGIAYIF
jgi:hypothetical protein